MPLSAATRTWTGAAGTQAWSNPANWNGGVPAAGDDLLFPESAASFTSTNDVPAGLDIHSITISLAGLRVDGNPIVLGGGGITVTNRFIVSIVTVTIDAPIALAAPQTWTFAPNSEATRFAAVDLAGNTLTLDVNSRAPISFTSMTGTGGIVKRGSSDAFIFSSTFGGPLSVDGGDMHLVGVTTGDVTVGTGATLNVGFPSQPQGSNVGNLALEPGAHFVTADESTLKVTGTVALNTATLDVVNATSPTLTVIDNDGVDPISGSFLGLAESAMLSISGRSYRLSYVGGDGNDVTLTRLDVAAAATQTALDSQVSRQSVTLTVTVTSFGSTPSGTVTFYDNGALLGSATLDAFGHATVTMPFTPGVHEITAAYTGSSGFATSRAAIEITVARNRAAAH